MQNLSGKSGAPPGTLVYFGKDSKEPVRITLLQYNEQELYEQEFSDIDECVQRLNGEAVRWINVDGIHDTSVVEKVGRKFGIHPLTLEDVVNTAQRAKVEDYEHYTACIMKMVYSDRVHGQEFNSEQLSIILFDNNTLISFQEADGGDVFDVIRERIRQSKGKIRKAGADYLAYALMDAVVDSYFTVLEQIGDDLGELEDDLLTDPNPSLVKRLHHYKRQMIFLRKAAWPMREMVNSIERSENKFFSESTGIYLRDVHDHALRVIDTVETYRDLLAGMMDIYLSSVSNKMNEVMKTLTIITTIFVPLTFIVGVYGMNMYIPEAQYKWFYPVLWGIMIGIAGLLFFYFYRKKWLR